MATILAYRRSLSTLGARRDVVESLDGALKVLKANLDSQGELFAPRSAKRALSESDLLRGRDPNSLPVEEVWDIITDDEVSRRTLERIAIERFAVPKGSMRSFSSIPLLREKIVTLMRNDATHTTISQVSQSANTG